MEEPAAQLKVDVISLQAFVSQGLSCRSRSKGVTEGDPLAFPHSAGHRMHEGADRAPARPLRPVGR